MRVSCFSSIKKNTTTGKFKNKSKHQTGKKEKTEVFQIAFFSQIISFLDFLNFVTMIQKLK